MTGGAGGVVVLALLIYGGMGLVLLIAGVVVGRAVARGRTGGGGFGKAVILVGVPGLLFSVPGLLVVMSGGDGRESALAFGVVAFTALLVVLAALGYSDRELAVPVAAAVVLLVVGGSVVAVQGWVERRDDEQVVAVLAGLLDDAGLSDDEEDSTCPGGREPTSVAGDGRRLSCYLFDADATTVAALHDAASDAGYEVRYVAAPDSDDGCAMLATTDRGDGLDGGALVEVAPVADAPGIRVAVAEGAGSTPHLDATPPVQSCP